MRFQCNFINQDTDECRTIVTALSAADCRSVESLCKNKGSMIAGITAEAIALRQAYSEVPSRFRHVEPPAQIHLS